MKFPIPLSVTTANPDSDLPETKLCFLYVTECLKHFSCLSFQLITSSIMDACILYNFCPPLFSISPLYVLFPGMSMLISVCLLVCVRKNKRRHRRTRKSKDKEDNLCTNIWENFPALFILCIIYFIIFIVEWKQCPLFCLTI